MSTDDTRLEAVDCPHDECKTSRNVLVPRNAVILGTSKENDAPPDATGRVRADCAGHQFYVHFAE